MKKESGVTNFDQRRRNGPSGAAASTGDSRDLHRLVPPEPPSPQRAPPCPTCGRAMTEVQRKGIDGYTWRCPQHKAKRQSIRDGSFFAHSHVSLRKWIVVLYFPLLSFLSSLLSLLPTLISASPHHHSLPSFPCTCTPSSLPPKT